MRVALVSVGDEILAGDTINTNAAWLGRELTERGVSVERVTVVPDRVGEIARVVNEYRAEYDAVIVTGGLGPTHDDVTIEAVAAAVGRGVEESETALWWLLEEGGYAHEDLVEGTADLPAGARPIHNEVGVAPGCVIEGVYVLPGVPSEMKGMFPRIADEFAGEVSHVETVVADEPESALIDRMEQVQAEFGVKVGSYPGDSVRLKLEHTDPDVVAAAADWLRERVDHVTEEEP